jgi:hypothetical protein
MHLQVFGTAFLKNAGNLLSKKEHLLSKLGYFTYKPALAALPIVKITFEYF